MVQGSPSLSPPQRAATVARPSSEEAPMQNLPGDREILSLIKHLDSLDRPPGELFRWAGGEEKEPGVITFPWVDYSPQVREFVADLYGLGFIVPFDWPAWQEEGFQLQT